jgi:uncharacterized membrane protein YdjX (TVP38/TMEM64 family)
MGTKRRNLVRVALLIAAGCLVFWLFRLAEPRYLLRLALERIQGLGPLAPLLFIVVYVVSCLVFFPGIILTLGAGILFGVVWGTVYVCLGATLGASTAFLLSRYFARQWLLKKFSSSLRFRAIDQAVEKDGWKVVGLMRLSPVFPFIPLNFIFGATSVPYLHFAAATAIGILPATFMFVYLGSLIGSLAELGHRPIATGQAKWVVTALGVITTMIVTIAVTRLARRALARTLPEIEA